MEFGKKQKKEERDSLVRRDEIFHKWFTPFDDFSTSRSRGWMRDIEETMTKHMEVLMRKTESGAQTEPVVYGWSLKVVNGKPEFQEFGNVKPETSERNPIVDVLDNTEGFTVIVELPGVEKNEINVETSATELFIETTGTKKYKKNVNFGEEIDQSSVTSQFKNGILEIKCRKSNGNKRRVSVL